MTESTAAALYEAVAPILVKPSALFLAEVILTGIGMISESIG